MKLRKILWAVLIAGNIALFFMGMCITGKSHAFELPKLDLNITEGTSYTKRAPNGVWWQAGMPYKYQLAADSRNIALSGWYNDWLKIEGNYIDFGSTNGSLSFVSDENYSGNEKDPCRHPCEAARSATWRGESKLLGISALPTYRYHGNEIGGRIGFARHNTETNVIAQNFHDAYIKDPNPSIGYYNMSHRGTSWYYGGQLKVKENLWRGTVNLIYLHAPDVRSGYDGFQRGIKFLHLSYRKDF